jgi:hypothetical protein
MQTREEANTEASLLNTPLAVPLTTLSTSNATPTRMSRICFARHGRRFAGCCASAVSGHAARDAGRLLRCGISAGLMPALGHGQTNRSRRYRICFTTINGRPARSGAYDTDHARQACRVEKLTAARSYQFNPSIVEVVHRTEDADLRLGGGVAVLSFDVENSR